jgi:hypothetical protein
VTEQSAPGFSIWGEASACRLEFDYEFNATEAIMEFDGLEIVRMELKYCETEDVYCPARAVQLSDLPEGRRRAKPLLLVNDRVEIKSQCEEWSAFFGEGGNA